MLLAASLLSAHPRWIDGGWVHGLMVAAAVLVLLVPRVWSQLLALLLGGLVGLCALTPPELEPSAPERLVVPLRRSVSVVLLGFAVLLFVAMQARPLLVQQLSGFLRTGALVFGGGHGAPLAGTSLGTQRLDRPAAKPRRCQGRCSFHLQPGLQGIAGSVLALVALFFSSFLLVGGLLPFWSPGPFGSDASSRLGINASGWASCWRRCFSPSGRQGSAGVLTAWRWWRLCCWCVGANRRGRWCCSAPEWEV